MINKYIFIKVPNQIALLPVEFMVRVKYIHCANMTLEGLFTARVVSNYGNRSTRECRLQRHPNTSLPLCSPQPYIHTHTHTYLHFSQQILSVYVCNVVFITLPRP